MTPRTAGCPVHYPSYITPPTPPSRDQYLTELMVRDALSQQKLRLQSMLEQQHKLERMLETGCSRDDYNRTVQLNCMDLTGRRGVLNPIGASPSFSQDYNLMRYNLSASIQ